MNDDNILKLKSFRSLYIAGLTSELGSFITDTAIMLFVFALSAHDKSTLGITRAVFLFCITIGSLIGGPLGVRFPKRNLLIMSEVLRIPLVISLFFIHHVPFVIIANGMIGFFTGIYNPSRQSLINEIVPENKIKAANSLFGSTMAVLHLVGPLVGASLYSFTKRVDEVLFLDIFTYIIGIYFLLQIKHFNVQHSEKNNKTFLQNLRYDFVEGFRYVKTRPDVFVILSSTVILGFGIGVLIPLLLPYTLEVLGKGETEYGIGISLFGLGGIIGGYLSHKLNNKFPAGKIFAATLILEGLNFFVWLYSTIFWLNCIALIIWGIIVFVRIPSELNYFSTTVDKEFLSRIHSFFDLSFVVPNITAGMFVAWVIQYTSTFNVLLGASIIMMIFIFLQFFTRGMREILKAS